MRPTLSSSSVRGPRFWATLPALVGLALSMACTSSVDTNQCSTNEDCAAVGTDALCEINNYCTFADPTCMGSGRRWEIDAEDGLGGICFDPSQLNPGTSTGMTSTSGSTTDAATSSISAADTSTTTGDEPDDTTGDADTDAPDTDDAAGSSSGSGGGESGSSEGGDTDVAAESSSSTGSESDDEPVYDAPEHCDEAFGDLPDYQGCSGDEERCQFSVSLIDTDYRNCRGLCASLGWACEDALHNPEGGGCEPTPGDEQAACDEEADDQICVCAGA